MRAMCTLPHITVPSMVEMPRRLIFPASACSSCQPGPCCNNYDYSPSTVYSIRDFVEANGSLRNGTNLQTRWDNQSLRALLQCHLKSGLAKMSNNSVRGRLMHSCSRVTRCYPRSVRLPFALQLMWAESCSLLAFAEAFPPGRQSRPTHLARTIK